MKYFLLITICLLITFSGQVRSDDPRLMIRFDDVIVSMDDTLISVPIRLAHPIDTIAGIELLLELAKNDRVTLTLDEVDADGNILVADTVGTMISGWEWLGITPIDNSAYKMKISAMADWPDKTETPPAYPAKNDLLFNLILRQNTKQRLGLDTVFTITVEPKGSGFADPKGNTIGVITTIEEECQEYKDDSCLVWKRVRRGYLDSNVVRFGQGKITIVDTLGMNKK